MLVDVRDFLPPDYKLPEKETAEHGSLRIAERKEDFNVKASGSKKLDGGVGQGSTSNQGNKSPSKLKSKPLAKGSAGQIFILLRRGKVLPGNEKAGRPKKRRVQVANPEATTGGSSSSTTTTTTQLPPTTGLPEWKIKEVERDLKKRWEEKEKVNLILEHFPCTRLPYCFICGRSWCAKAAASLEIHAHSQDLWFCPKVKYGRHQFCLIGNRPIGKRGCEVTAFTIEIGTGFRRFLSDLIVFRFALEGRFGNSFGTIFLKVLCSPLVLASCHRNF